MAQHWLSQESTCELNVESRSNAARPTGTEIIPSRWASLCLTTQRHFFPAEEKCPSDQSNFNSRFSLAVVISILYGDFIGSPYFAATGLTAGCRFTLPISSS